MNDKSIIVSARDRWGLPAIVEVRISQNVREGMFGTFWGMPRRRWVILVAIAIILSAAAIGGYVAYSIHKEAQADQAAIDTISKFLGYSGDDSVTLRKYLQNWMM